MSPLLLRRPSLLAPLALAALAACQDSTGPRPGLQPKAHYAQGDNNTWTVNTLADPSAGANACDETECTIREAILAAAPGGTIVFANGLQGSINLDTGGGFLQISKDLTIDGGGRITFDAKGASRVVAVTGAATKTKVKLIGLRLTGGDLQNAGGGIFAVQASLILENVVVSENRSYGGDGGGIYLNGSDATLTASRVDSNWANGVSSPTAGRGGGIFVGSDAQLTLVNSTVDGNESDGAASGGGGIYNRGSTSITASTISNNRTPNAGGGLLNAFEAIGRVVGSTFSGNFAEDGGGIGNSGSLEVRSSTLAYNTATDGAGILGFQTARVANSVIAGNSGLSECAGSLFSLGHNLKTTSGDCSFAAAGDVSVQFLQVATEVLEQEMKDNGGPTKTHALIARGRAVDVGYCPGETTDQRGFSRPVDDPIMPNAVDGCDVGAYELQGPVAPVADLMLSQAVDKASAKQGEQVTYTVRVQNLGPQTAPSVVVTNVLSDGATFVEARSDRGTFKAPPQGETGTVTWTLGDMQNGANEAAYISVTVLIRGRATITNAAAVTGAVADPDTANNSAAITVSVASGSSGGTKKPK